MSLSSVQVRVGDGVVAWELAPMIGAYHYGCSTREKKKTGVLYDLQIPPSCTNYTSISRLSETMHYLYHAV